MMKPMFDQESLVEAFAKAGAEQGEALRKAVSSATLKALQSRELTLDGVKKTVGAVVGAASIGIARNVGPKVDVGSMLGSTLAGIDSALLQAVEANRKALEQFMSRGATLADKPVQDALATVEKIEDAFFDAVGKAGQSSGSLQAPWNQALAAFKGGDGGAGSQAGKVAGDLIEQTRATLRASRSAGMRASQAMLSGYAAMVNGILIGMSEGMRASGSLAQGGGSSGAAASAPAPPPSAASPSAKTSTAAKKTAAKRPRRKTAAKSAR